MSYLLTSESVSEGHPDKIADQISDAILDEFLRQDPQSKVAIETFVTTGLVIVGGEVRSTAYVDLQETSRKAILSAGYTKAEYMFDGNSCGVLSAVHEQSDDIYRGVDRKNVADQGAGDQGVMYGYACSETEDYMPLPISLSHKLLMELADIRKNTNLMPYLRPDAKTQFTVEYNNDRTPKRVHTIVLSTQHDEFDIDDSKMLSKISEDVKKILIPKLVANLPLATAKLFTPGYELLVNPTGKFVIGGPHGDTGLTGRKIIVDTYGGRGSHGGGAFSGKDPSKVDRSAAYAARYVAKNLVAAGVADELLLQFSYAIGVADPVSIYVNTYGTAHKNKAGKIFSDAEIAKKVKNILDLRPATIIDKFGLRNPIYYPTATYGHVGRKPYTQSITIKENGKEQKRKVQFFGWELLDSVPKIKEKFGF